MTANLVRMGYLTIRYKLRIRSSKLDYNGTNMSSVMVTKIRTRNPKSCVPRELFNAANLAN